MSIIGNAEKKKRPRRIYIKTLTMTISESWRLWWYLFFLNILRSFLSCMQRACCFYKQKNIRASFQLRTSSPLSLRPCSLPPIIFSAAYAAFPGVAGGLPPTPSLSRLSVSRIEGAALSFLVGMSPLPWNWSPLRRDGTLPCVHCGESTSSE